MKFHHILAKPTQNALVVTLIDAIGEQLREARQMVSAVMNPERVQTYHRQIFEAVTQCNGHAARAAMRIHIQLSREVLLENLGKIGEASTAA